MYCCLISLQLSGLCLWMSLQCLNYVDQRVSSASLKKRRHGQLYLEVCRQKCLTTLRGRPRFTCQTSKEFSFSQLTFTGYGISPLVIFSDGLLNWLSNSHKIFYFTLNYPSKKKLNSWFPSCLSNLSISDGFVYNKWVTLITSDYKALDTFTVC